MFAKLPKILPKNILVVGDLMLDEYWEGKIDRISPEAPVPIALITNKYYRAGGAANVALNISGLNSNVTLLGIIGADQSGRILQDLLDQGMRIESSLNVENAHPTINKLRIISNNQQLFRIDQEKWFTAVQADRLYSVYAQMLQSKLYDMIVLSDYNKGSLQHLSKFIDLANQQRIPTLVDPKNPEVRIYNNATILTPNLLEFKKMLGISSNVELTASEINLYGHKLMDLLNLAALVITQGKDGLTVLTKEHADQYIPAYTKEVFDVTGAGDTVVATLAVALANGYTLSKGAELATIAAGIAVSKSGTYSVSLPEIEQAIVQIEFSSSNQISDPLNLGIINEDLLMSIVEQRKLLGETIVLVNGCFDVIHAGHIQYLAKARSYGDRLIVAVNDDDSIRQLKGDTRPINSLRHRMQVLAGLKVVDWVVPFGNSKEICPGRIIAKLAPNVLIKSKEVFNNISEVPDCEGGFIIKNGGTIYLLDRPISPEHNISSTKIIESIDPLALTQEIFCE